MELKIDIIKSFEQIYNLSLNIKINLLFFILNLKRLEVKVIDLNFKFTMVGSQDFITEKLKIFFEK